MSKKYRVIALSVGGLNNKIFHSQEIVREDNFKEGRAEELVRADFLEEITEENQMDISGIKNSKELLGINEFDIEDIKRNLSNNGISFKANSSKKQLYDLYVQVIRRKEK